MGDVIAILVLSLFFLGIFREARRQAREDRAEALGREVDRYFVEE